LKIRIVKHYTQKAFPGQKKSLISSYVIKYKRNPTKELVMARIHFRALACMVLAMAGLFIGCNRDLSPFNTVTSSYGGPPPCAGTPAIEMYCDFESPLVNYSDYGGGGPSYENLSQSKDTAISCTTSWKLSEGPSAATWLFPWEKYFPPTATTFKMWYKIDKILPTTLSWQEGSSLGADGESWSIDIVLNPSAAWQELLIPLSCFTSSGGNNIPDVQSVTGVYFYHSGPYPYAAHTLYIDDIRFGPCPGVCPCAGAVVVVPGYSVP
jgi:hypothetical protein